MFSSGNVTVYVSNMDTAVRFYTETLGLKLAYRFGDHWASVEVGKGLTIGLHPASSAMPAGRKGSMSIGLELTGSIKDAVKALEAKGVRFHEVVNEGKAGSFVSFDDPDGNLLYLAELRWSHVEQGEGTYQGARS
ncbi:MAG TPA: VOC family protein [Bryobacteraceae bacterium]|nr:VOC family protein [Bryobacteraceae bacterium]